MREIKIMFKAIPTIVIFLCLLYVTLLRVTMETVPVQLGYALGIALLGGLVMLCVRNYSIKIVRMDILISVYVLYRLVMCYVDSGFGIGIGTQAILYMFGVYIAGRIAFQDERRGMYIFSMLFMLCGIYEAALGLGQLYGNTPSGHGMYRVTGTFFNPGPYSCYPAMVAAYAGIYIYKNYTAFIDIYRQNGWRSAARFDNGLILVAAVALVVSIIVLPATLSRAAMVAVGSMFFIASIKRQKRKTIVLLLIAVSCLSVGLYFFKQGSADARVLMWRTSLGVLKSYGLWGAGDGSFLGAYALGQQQYFRENVDSQLLSVASNPDFPFNEYLRVGVEAGMIGLVLFVMILGMACYGYYKKRDTLGFALGALAVFSFFSYPLSMFPYQILLALLLAGSVTNETGIIRRKRSKVVSIITVIGLLILTPWGIDELTKRAEAMKAYKELSYFTKLGLEENLDKEYAPLQEHLKDVPGYFFDYGKYLQSKGEYNRSNYILRQGMKISSDPMFYNVMGNNYKAMGADWLALEAYQTAFEIVPNRIYPLYLTFKLYKERENSDLALEMANKIVNFNPKVESPATRDIKKEAIVFADSLENKLKEQIL